MEGGYRLIEAVNLKGFQLTLLNIALIGLTDEQPHIYTTHMY